MADRTNSRGGVAAYLRFKVAEERVKIYVFNNIYFVEHKCQKNKMAVYGIYIYVDFQIDCELTIGKASAKYSDFEVCGGLNFNVHDILYAKLCNISVIFFYLKMLKANQFAFPQ